MHRPRSSRLTHHAADGPVIARLEDRLRTEAREIHEPADEVRVQAVVQRLRAEQADAAPPHRRPVLHYVGWMSLAAACLMGAALLSLAWFGDATPPTPVATNQADAPAVDQMPTEWMTFQNPIAANRTIDLWTRLELEAEWQNLRLDAARFVGPLAVATEPPATEPNISSQ